MRCQMSCAYSIIWSWLAAGARINQLGSIGLSPAIVVVVGVVVPCSSRSTLSSVRSVRLKCPHTHTQFKAIFGVALIIYISFFSWCISRSSLGPRKIPNTRVLCPKRTRDYCCRDDDCVRCVVASAVDGDALNLCLTTPINYARRADDAGPGRAKSGTHYDAGCCRRCRKNGG